MNQTQGMASAAATHWRDIQEATFTRWCNDELKRRGMRIENLQHDLKDGVLLINLLEIISGKSLGRYNKHPRIIQQKLENLNIAINFIKSEGLKLVNVGSDDICSGNVRITLGLIWVLVLRYEINRGNDGDEDNDLLKWIQSKIPEYGITGFKKDWNDGKAVCALVDAVRPGKFPGHADLDPANKLENATAGIAAAEAIGVDKLIYPEEMTNPKVDKLAMMTYLAQFRNLPDEIINYAGLCHAYGPGLVEGIKDQEAPFTIEKPAEAPSAPAVVVTDASGGEIPASIEDVSGDGTKFECKYTPSGPGTHQVSITLDGEHIPGSVFAVNVLEKESLGGEGKIRVFFSSTTSSQKSRSDYQALETLFATKKVHLRDDFEAWVAVDLLDKSDRDAIFRVAGCRKLPIVFVDDVYQGDYDRMRELEERGELDALLNMHSATLISEEEHMQRLKMMSSDPRASILQQQPELPTGGAAAPGGAPAPVAEESAPAAAAQPASGGSKFCVNCGAPRGANKFCGECGTKF